VISRWEDCDISFLTDVPAPNDSRTCKRVRFLCMRATVVRSAKRAPEDDVAQDWERVITDPIKQGQGGVGVDDR
jgi:hypothetical protein